MNIYISMHAYYSRLHIAPVIAEDSYVLVVIFLFFRPLIFQRPWADFHETMPHDAVYPEIVYFL